MKRNKEIYSISAKGKEKETIDFFKSFCSHYDLNFSKEVRKLIIEKVDIIKKGKYGK